MVTDMRRPFGRVGIGGAVIGSMVVMGPPLGVGAAELPAHDPLTIVIVSDEVNPNGLSDDELTQPDDLQAALANPDSGLVVADIVGADSQCVDAALDSLADPEAVDVLVYFAHFAATACDGSARQAELIAAVEAFLRAGGGVVVFHHGIYTAPGKEAILQLLGASASSIAWDPANGQDVIAVAPDHFVTNQGMDYAQTRTFEGAGVAPGQYGFFTNVPDERYESLALLPEAGDTRTILFASADATGAGARVLSYDLHRTGWMGHVVFYQPGEYQPQALDDLDGNNFQVLANAIVYVATTIEEGEPDGDTGDTSDTGDDSVDDSGGLADSGSSSGDPPDGGGTIDSGSTGTGDTAAAGGEGGCGCRAVPGPAWPLLGIMALARRRRPRL